MIGGLVLVDKLTFTLSGNELISKGLYSLLIAAKCWEMRSADSWSDRFSAWWEGREKVWLSVQSPGWAPMSLRILYACPGLLSFRLSTLLRMYFSAALQYFVSNSEAIFLYFSELPFLTHSLCLLLCKVLSSKLINGLSWGPSLTKHAKTGVENKQHYPPSSPMQLGPSDDQWGWSGWVQI